MEIFFNLSSTNTSFQKKSTSYLILDTSTQNSGLLCQSKTSPNLLKIVPYTGPGSYNPTTQTSGILLVIRNVSGMIDSGKVLKIVPHSSTSSGLHIVGVNNTFSGSLTGTNYLSATILQLLIWHVLIYIDLSIQVLLLKKKCAPGRSTRQSRLPTKFFGRAPTPRVVICQLIH